MESLKKIFLGVIVILLISGCSRTWHPGSSPAIDLGIVPPYTEALSVALINNQPNTEPQLFAGVGGTTHYANYNEWTQFFIEQWKSELTKRGVNVSDDSPNKINVKLSDFAFFQGFAKVRVNMKVLLESPDKSWAKEYLETDTSGWSMGRAFGSVIYHTIEKLLNDPEIIGKMRVEEIVSPK